MRVVLAAAALLAVVLPLAAERPDTSRLERRLKKCLEESEQRASSELGEDLDAALGTDKTLAAIRKRVTFDRCKEDIYFLACDDLKGRDTGSEGHRKAAQWAADKFAEAGLKPVGDDGTYFQNWKWQVLQGKKRVEQQTMNVVAYLPGETDELVVVGAHLDHVGQGPANMWTGRMQHPLSGGDDIYNGADDNASGSVTVVEMGCALGHLKVKPKRGILFMLFSGEEKGLVGSKYYVDHPIFPLKDTVAMLNYDMVGRNADHECELYGGNDGSPELGAAAAKLNEAFDIKFTAPPRTPFIYAQSDNWSFHPKGVPSIFFTSGMHTEYHTALDHPDLINVGKLEEMAEFGAALALNVANMAERPSWHEINLGPRLGVAPGEVGPKKRGELGLKEGEGAIIFSGVTRGLPADLAGLKAGDFLVAIDGKPLPVKGAMDKFRERIYEADKQTFTVIRGDQRLEIPVDYTAKPKPKPKKEKAEEKPADDGKPAEPPKKEDPK